MKKLLFILTVFCVALTSCHQKLDIDSNWEEIYSHLRILHEAVEYAKMGTVSDAEAESSRIADSIAAMERIMAEVTMEMEGKVMSQEDILKKNREDSIASAKQSAINGKEQAMMRFCAILLNTVTGDSIENRIDYLKKDLETQNKGFEKSIFKLSDEKEINWAQIAANAYIEEYNRLLNVYENGNIVDMKDYNVVEGPDGDDGSKNYKITSKKNSIENYFVNIKKGKKQPVVNLHLVNP